MAAGKVAGKPTQIRGPPKEMRVQRFFLFVWRKLGPIGPLCRLG